MAQQPTVVVSCSAEAPGHSVHCWLQAQGIGGLQLTQAVSGRQETNGQAVAQGWIACWTCLVGHSSGSSNAANAVALVIAPSMRPKPGVATKSPQKPMWLAGQS